LAAYNAAEAALRHLKPGSNVSINNSCSSFYFHYSLILFSYSQNFQITETIDKIADSYKCKPVEGMLSYQLEKNLIDGTKRIIQNPSEMQK
jgi:hypothetical protein